MERITEQNRSMSGMLKWTVLKAQIILNLGGFINYPDFEELQKTERKVTNMCQVIDEFEAVGERRGEIIGEIKALYFRLNKKPVEIADEMNLSVNEVQSIIDKILSEKKDNSENE